MFITNIKINFYLSRYICNNIDNVLVMRENKFIFVFKKIEMIGSEIFGDIGTIVGITALIFAIYENRKRTKIENVFKTYIQSFPGEIALIERQCQWANTNVRDAVAALNQIPD